MTDPWEELTTKQATVQARIICDHSGCDKKYQGDTGFGIGRTDELPESWAKATNWPADPQDEQALMADSHFCPEHKDLHCIDENFYYGCGRQVYPDGTCNSIGCAYHDIDRRKQRRFEQEYSDSWGFGKKASRLDDVIGYVYDSDIHCPECTHEQFKDTDNAEDSDGNPISPIFREYDFDFKNDICGDCGTHIYEDECHHCGEAKPGYQLESSPYKHTWGMVCHDCLLKDPHIEKRDDYCNKCGESNIFIKGSKNCLNCDKGKLDPHNIGMLGQCLQCDGSDEELYSDSWGFGKKASTFHHCDHQDQTGTCKNIAQYDDEDELHNWRSDSFYDTKHNMVHIGNDRHYCPEHKNLYCRQCDIPMQKEDIADGYTECFNCHNCNDNIGKYGVCQRCTPNEDFEEEYTDAWGFGKKALNYFSLDQPNEAIMPGMAQNEPNPDSGMEDGVTQDFPGMHDYERGLSAAASVKQAYHAIHCDDCDIKYDDQYSFLNQQGWIYDLHRDVHYCPDCKKDRCPQCCEELDDDDKKFNRIHHNDTCQDCHDCLNTLGKYDQCLICDGSDKEREEDYSNGWGFDKKAHKSDGTLGWGKGQRIVQASFEKVIFCDDCGDPDPDLGEYVNKNWGRASLNGFSKDDPKNPTKYDDWQELHFCPNCKEGRHLDDNITDPFKMTFGCGSKMNSFGECSKCFGDDQSYIDDYASGWGFNKKAGVENINFRRVTCDDCGKFVVEKFANDYGNRLIKNKTENWNIGFRTKCPECYSKINRIHFGPTEDTTNRLGWNSAGNYGRQDATNYVTPARNIQQGLFDKSGSVIKSSTDSTETKFVTSQLISSVDRPDLSHMFTTINGFSTGSPTNAKRDIISHLKSLAPNGSHTLFETAPSKISKRSLSSLGLNHALIDDIKTTNAIKVNYYSAHFPRNYFDNIDRNYSSYMNNSYSSLDTTYTRQSINELGSGNAWTIRIHHAIPEGNFHDQLNEAERKHQIILKTISDNPASTHQDKLKSDEIKQKSDKNINKTESITLDQKTIAHDKKEMENDKKMIKQDENALKSDEKK